MHWGNAWAQVRSTGEEGAISVRIKSWKYLSANRNVSLILHKRKWKRARSPKTSTQAKRPRKISNSFEKQNLIFLLNLSTTNDIMYWVGQKVCSSVSVTPYEKARMNFLDNPIKAKSQITIQKYLLKLLDTLILFDSYRKRNEVLVDLPNNLKTHSSILWGRNRLKSRERCMCMLLLLLSRFSRVRLCATP